MDDAIRKAEALIEARGYIRTFRDRLTVIKLGGSAMENPAVLAATLEDVVFMETAGMRPLLVHGGGKAIDRAMATANLRPTKVQGRRATVAIPDEPAMVLLRRGLLAVMPVKPNDAPGQHDGGAQAIDKERPARRA